MNEEEIQELAVKAQDKINSATRDVIKIRSALCNMAKNNPSYSESVKASNAVLINLLAAHSDGIDALNLAPSVVIMPQFGGT